MSANQDSVEELATKAIEQTSAFGIADSDFGSAVIGAVAALIVCGLTYFLQKKSQEEQNQQLLYGHWSALRAEIVKGGQMANHHGTHGISAPSYRLPTLAYEVSMPHILANADLDERHMDQLQEFYVQVASLNRGLNICESYILRDEITNEIKMHENEMNLGILHNRNRLKSATIVDKSKLSPDALKEIEDFVYHPQNRWRTEVGAVFEKALWSCDVHIARLQKKKVRREFRLPWRREVKSE